MTAPSSTALAAREEQHPIVAALEQRSDVIASLLPRTADVERFKRVVLQSINRNPDLKKCTPNSIVDAAAEAARLGLEPSGAIGGAHLVPYGNKAQLIVDYRGLVELARRSGEIAAIDATIVRQADRFHVSRGTQPSIEHEPDLEAPSPADPTDEANPVTHVYAVARLRNGQRQFDVMTRHEVERIRGRSRAGNAGPWRTDWHEMAKKTVLRRLSKTLPLTVEVRALLEMEDEAERPPVVVVEGGRSDRLGGLRGAMRQRTEALTAEPDETPAAEVQATVADAARPTTRPTAKKRANKQPGQALPAEEGAGGSPDPNQQGTPPPVGQPPAPVQTPEEPSLEDAQKAVHTAAVKAGLAKDVSKIKPDSAEYQETLAANWSAIDGIAAQAIPDRPVADLEAADWTFVTERIAAGDYDGAAE